MSSLSGPVKISVLSSPSHLPIVRAALEKVCELTGFDEGTTGRIVLAVDEAMTNIIRHAYDGQDGKPIDVELAPAGPRGGLRVSLRDYGKRTDPDKIRSRDLADVRPGGLGVHIISQCMDRMEYRHAPGGGTLLVLEKLLPDEVTK